MDAMKIENFLYGKYDEVLSIVDVVMFPTVMAVWCAFAICRVTSYRKHRTNSSRQPAVQYWEKKCNKSEVPKL